MQRDAEIVPFEDFELVWGSSLCSGPHYEQDDQRHDLDGLDRNEGLAQFIVEQAITCPGSAATVAWHGQDVAPGKTQKRETNTKERRRQRYIHVPVGAEDIQEAT